MPAKGNQLNAFLCLFAREITNKVRPYYLDNMYCPAGLLLSPIIHTLVFEVPQPPGKQPSSPLMLQADTVLGALLQRDPQCQGRTQRMDATEEATLRSHVLDEPAHLSWGTCAFHSACCSLLVQLFDATGKSFFDALGH